MLEQLLDVARRVVGSKKVALAAITLLVDVGAVWGFDVPADQLTAGIGAVWNGLGAGLVAIQGVLDAVHGSASDGTVRKGS